MRQDDQQSMPDLWRIVGCATCGSFYLDPRPTRDSLGKAYEDYYTHQMDAGDPATAGDTIVSRAVNGYLNRRFGMRLQPASRMGGYLFGALPPLRMKLDVFGRHVPRHLCEARGRLLDVGCGNGAFVARATSMGLVAKGSDPDPKAVAAGRQKGLEILEGDVFSAHWNAARFDWITMNHVIEHVEAPRQVIARAFELLAPGGHLWLGLPNPGALGARWLGAGWSGLHPPYHLLIPSQKVLVQWLGEAGFTSIRFIRRGIQSAGMWRQSRDLCRREGLLQNAARVPVLRIVGDVLASMSARWAEETIALAQRPERDD